MYLKRVLIFSFWLVVWFSAIYLRAAIFPSNEQLILISTVDVLLLFVLSQATLWVLAHLERKEVLIKVGGVVAVVLTVSLCRYMLEAYQMGYWEGNFPTIGSRMLVAKALSSVVIVGITLAYYLGLKFVQAKEERMIFEMEKKQLELDFLKSRVNPHFLFNTLSNIHGLAIFNSSKTAPMIEKLSDLMRYMFYDCQQEKILLQKEMSFIESYISLYRLKSEKKLDITFQHCMEDSGFEIEPLIFVGFIENAFKHGDVFHGGYIHISLTQKGNTVKFMCVNTYQQTEQGTQEQSGFGLQNVVKRLKKLYPNTHHFQIRNNKLFEVDLEILIK